MRSVCAEGRGDAVVEAREAGDVDVVGGRQLHLGERLPRGALDRGHEPALARSDEADRVAGASGAPGAADAVHVRLGVGRDVEVDHVRDALDVEAARGDIRGDEDVELARLQLVDGPLALHLRDVAVDRRRGVAAGAELLGDLLGRALGAGEDDHALEVLDLEDAREGVDLLLVRHDQVALGGRGRGRGLRLDRDLFGVVQVLLRHAPDRGRHRRREERDLLGVGRVGEDRLDVLGEAHLQHLVGLVEHEVLELRQVERALVEVVHDAPGGADDDVHAAAQGRQLHAVALTAVDGQDVHAAHVRRVLLERLAHLQRELARRGQHERLRGLLRHVEAVEDRQRERRGLAGAGLGEPHDIAPGEQRRDRRGLDRGGGLVPDVAQRLEHRVAQSEVGERHRGGLCGSLGLDGSISGRHASG